MKDVYERLREHLDTLPGGFPKTEDGLEIRILKRLFTPEEAELAQHLRWKFEPASVIAKRAGIGEKEAEEALKKMSRRGLIFSIETPDRPPVFMAAQFVVGIWEYHVKDLDIELIKDMERYIPYLAKDAFDYVPQLRVVPVKKSIRAETRILPYENVEELVREQKKILVAPCICRMEHKIKGKWCGRMVETCLIFGWAADYYERNGLGRKITLEETLDILKRAEEEALVLQPSNSEKIVNICCCCGDCCQVLLHIKRHPAPAFMVSSPFIASADPDICEGCGTCVERCQMDAITLEDEKVKLDKTRCIGCGLCVSTCPSGALKLERKPESEQKPLPKDPKEQYLWRLKARAEANAGLREKLERLKKIEGIELF